MDDDRPCLLFDVLFSCEAKKTVVFRGKIVFSLTCFFHRFFLLLNKQDPKEKYKKYILIIFSFRKLFYMIKLN